MRVTFWPTYKRTRWIISEGNGWLAEFRFCRGRDWNSCICGTFPQGTLSSRADCQLDSVSARTSPSSLEGTESLKSPPPPFPHPPFPPFPCQTLQHPPGASRGRLEGVYPPLTDFGVSLTPRYHRSPASLQTQVAFLQIQVISSVLQTFSLCL